MKLTHLRTWFCMLATMLGLGNITAQTYALQAGDKVATDDGIYIVKGNNLIANPSFDDGTTGWTSGTGADLTSDNFEVVGDNGADGGAYLRALSGAGSSSAASLRTAWPIESGKTYVISLWAYRPSVDGNAQYSQIHLGTSATDANHQIGSVSYSGGAWKQTQIVFESGSYTYCIARFSWLTKSAGFDCFNLYEVEASDELVLDKLISQIETAENLLSSTEEGTGKGQYTADVRQALQSAIDTANGVKGSATSQTEVNEAITALKNACSAYSQQVNPPFALDKKYTIKHYNSDYVLTTGGDGGTVKIAAADANDMTQVFHFVIAPEGAAASGYNLVDDEGNYVYRSGSWDTKASASQDLTIANAIFQVTDFDKYVQLKNMGSGSVLGTDANSNGSTVYSNKNGTAANFCWTLTEFVPADQRDAEYNWNELIRKAKSEYASIKEAQLGNALFLYSRTAYDTYGKAISDAEALVPDYQAALDLLEAAMGDFAANCKNNPDPAAEYVITQVSSGLTMGYSESNELAVLSDAPQTFHIIASETAGAYYLQNTESSLFVAKSGSSNWNTAWETAKGNATAQWIIAANANGNYTLQNASGKGYMGSDDIVAGSELYCDKSATAVNSIWTIQENSVQGIVGAVLADAKALLDGAEVGTQYYEVPQSAYDALKAAIEKAEADMATATAASAPAIASSLQSAMNDFAKSYNPLSEFDTDLIYYFRHSGNCVLTTPASGNASITTIAEENKPSTAQQFMLEKATGALQYYIKSVSTEKYLTLSGDYNTAFTDTKDDKCIFRIDHLTGKYLGLYNTSKGTYFGTDGSASGQLVYSDKAATTLSSWTIETYQDLDRTAFTAAMTQAQDALAAMVEGYHVGEYFPGVKDEFSQYLSEQQTASRKCGSQEEIDALASTLQGSIATWQAKANTTNRAADFLARLITEAETILSAATVGVEKGQYAQADYDAYATAIATAKASSDAEAAISQLTAATETFSMAQVTIDRAALNSAISTAEKNIGAAVAGDCQGQYAQADIDSYRSAIDAAKDAHDDATLSQSDIDAAASTLKNATLDFTASKVVINFAELNKAISNAKKMLTDNATIKGDGPGQYPASAFDALQSAIDEASKHINSTTDNQATIDEIENDLMGAIDDFLASWHDLDKSELEALLATAKTTYEKGQSSNMSTDDLESLSYAIELGEAAMKATKQAEVDKAVKILKRDLSIFQDILDGVASILDGTANIQAIYDLSGKRLPALSRGLNIVRLANGRTLKVVK